MWLVHARGQSMTQEQMTNFHMMCKSSSEMDLCPNLPYIKTINLQV